MLKDRGMVGGLQQNPLYQENCSPVSRPTTINLKE